MTLFSLLVIFRKVIAGGGTLTWDTFSSTQCSIQITARISKLCYGLNVDYSMSTPLSTWPVYIRNSYRPKSSFQKCTRTQ